MFVDAIDLAFPFCIVFFGKKAEVEVIKIKINTTIGKCVLFADIANDVF